MSDRIKRMLLLSTHSCSLPELRSRWSAGFAWFPTARLPRLLVLLLLLQVPLLATGGCSTPDQAKNTSSITIEGIGYSTCFDEALLVARGSGMPPVLRDRAGGVVETAPRVSGSIFEPWRQDNAGLWGGFENTLNFQRRRARFEFVPAGFNPEPVRDSTVLSGPALPGSQTEAFRDLRSYEGPIELRVWVYVERSFRPGLQNATWTRSMTSFSTDRIGQRNANSTVSDTSTWTPVRRDKQYEVRLIDAFKKRIAELESS